MTTAASIRLVLFDIGGVVFGSPLHAIARYEEEHGIPPGSINRHVAASGPDGAWHRLERGELAIGERFFQTFDAELAASGIAVETRELMRRIADIAKPRPQMIDAIARLRESGYLVAALTNNWTEGEGTEARDGLKAELLADAFDQVIESRKVGLRKPDPEIYRLTCRLLGVEPPEVVFLDDIGGNLKSARALGMTTIKVDDPDDALAELEAVLAGGGAPG